MRQPAAHDVGDLGEDAADVERLGHRVQQAAQAVDPLAAQLFALDDGVVLEGEASRSTTLSIRAWCVGGERVVLRSR